MFSFFESVLIRFLDQATNEPTNYKKKDYQKEYSDLVISLGFGQGNTAKVPWIALLGFQQKVQQGIYPVFLYYKNYGLLILAYGISDTKKPEKEWPEEYQVQSIKSYFQQKNITTDVKYKASYVKKVYKIEPIQTNFGLDQEEIESDLDEILSDYLKVFSQRKSLVTDNEIKGTPLEFDQFKSRIFTIIKTKPFILLAGISGTGKTRLVKEIAYLFCPKELQNQQSPGNYQLIKVKPNWHDSSELIGYESRINEPQYIITDYIRFIAKAWMFPNIPFFLCLDEMNLAPVEQYFAEYLSILETRVFKDNKLISEPFISSSIFNKYNSESFWKDLDVKDAKIQNQCKEIGLTLPNNLIVMGTVNMDETTFSFSRKVLDRAMTIEINDIDLSKGLDESANIWKYPTTPFDSDLIIPKFTHGYQVAKHIENYKESIISYLNRVNIVLDNTPFKIAFRVRDEFFLFTYNYSQNHKDMNLTSILDTMTYMKILPRIEGDEDKTDVFDDLIALFDEFKLIKSSSKASFMKQMREKNHYTSFWI